MNIYSNQNIILIKIILGVLLLTLLVLDFLSISRIYSYLVISLIFLIAVIRFLRIRKFKKESLSYFRISHSWKGIIPIIIVIFFVFIAISYLPEIHSEKKFFIYGVILFMLPDYIYPIFVFSIVTYKNGIQTNVRHNAIIPWRNIDSVELIDKSIHIRINNKLKKIKYHPLDFDDVKILHNQFLKYKNSLKHIDKQ